MLRPLARLARTGKILVEAGLLLILPLIFSRSFSEQFTYPKRVFSEALVLLAAVAWTLTILWKKRVDTLSAFLTVGFWRSEKPTVNHKPIDRAYPMAWPLAFLTLAVLISCVNSPVPVFSLHESVYFLCGPAWALVLMGWRGESHEREVRQLYAFCAIGGTTVALLAVVQWTGHDPLLFSGYRVDWGTMVARMRLYATFGNPNFVAGYLIGTVFVAAALAVNSVHRLAQVVWGMAVAVMLAAIVGTGSRGAWIGLVAGLAIATAVLRSGAERPSASNRVATVEGSPAKVGVLSGLVCLGLFAGGWRAAEFLEGETLRYFGILVQHFEGRVFLWRAAWPMFTEHPILGSGWATFQLRFLDLQARALAAQPEMVIHWSNIRQLHNDLLQLMLEAGALGLFALGWALWAYTKQVRGSLPAPGMTRLWLAASAGGVTAILVDSLFNFQLAIPPTFILMFTLLVVPQILARQEVSSGPAVLGTPPAPAATPFTSGALIWRGAASLGIVAAAVLLLIQIGREAVAERDYALARLLESRGELERAEEIYRHGIHANPLNGRLHFGLARLLYLSERYREALEEVPRAERTFADSHLEVLKARVQDQMGLVQPALATYRHALVLDPTLKTVQADIERLSGVK